MEDRNSQIYMPQAPGLRVVCHFNHHMTSLIMSNTETQPLFNLLLATVPDEDGSPQTQALLGWDPSDVHDTLLKGFPNTLKGRFWSDFSFVPDSSKFEHITLRSLADDMHHLFPLVPAGS